MGDWTCASSASKSGGKASSAVVGSATSAAKRLSAVISAAGTCARSSSSRAEPEKAISRDLPSYLAISRLPTNPLDKAAASGSAPASAASAERAVDEGGWRLVRVSR